MAVVRLDAIQTPNWQVQLGELGGVVEDLAEIDQAIRIIVATPRGSRPLLPEFGSDCYLSLDAPVTVAAPAIIRDAHEAVRAWEPRAVVERIEPSFNGAGIDLTIYWRPAGDVLGVLRLTEVRL